MSKEQVVNELHYAARRRFVRQSTQMRGINDTLQADLIDMQPHARENRGMNYILTVINIFSKKAYALPLKDKSGQQVKKALESILDSLGHPIKNIHTDNGKEFYNSSVLGMLKHRNVHLYSTFSSMKAAICERFIRTLKTKMWKLFSLHGSYKWIDALPTLISEYNNTVHRTIGMRPKDVNAKNEKELLLGVYKNGPFTRPKQRRFKVGDKVRISKFKHMFEKGYTPNWTTEIFKIAKVKPTDPVTYLLEDSEGDPIKGAFYTEELLLAKYPDVFLIDKVLRRRGKQVYVKWLGLDSKHNSWIDENYV